MLADKRILVVEDEPIVALLVEDMLDELGATTIGPASTVRQAFTLLDTVKIDAAVLDVNLGRERSDAIADRLAGDETPFIFATGYGQEIVSGHRVEVLTKPYRIEQLEAALSRALSDLADGDLGRG